MYYQFMAALEDEETQKKGVIVVPYGIPKGRSPSEVWQVNTLMSTLPYKVQGFHIARPEWGVILNWMSSILENRSRLRIRSHSGTYMEVLYSVRCSLRIDLHVLATNNSTQPSDCNALRNSRCSS